MVRCALGGDATDVEKTESDVSSMDNVIPGSDVSGEREPVAAALERLAGALCDLSPATQPAAGATGCG